MYFLSVNSSLLSITHFLPHFNSNILQREKIFHTGFKPLISAHIIYVTKFAKEFYMLGKRLFLRIFSYMCIGALCYGSMEVVARGFTHISMGLLGGMCFVFIGLTGFLRRSGRLTLFQQQTVVTMFITVSELLCGMITNLWLGLNVWDYSELPFNFKGQICLPFCMLWFVLSYVGILADEWTISHIFAEYLPNRLHILRLRKITQ